MSPFNYTIEEIKNIPFVFIVGKGRSGTTMLQNILDSNENIIFPFESRLIIHLKSKYYHETKWDEKKIDELIQDLYNDRKFSQYWEVNPETLTKTLKQYPAKQLTFRIICKIIYLSFPSIYQKNKILLIGDKNPVYSLFVKDLLEIFPNAKFIHLVRDYRDNILSFRAAFGFRPAMDLAYSWLYFNKNVENFKLNHPNKFITLRYEDLTIDTESTVKKLCDFLGLNFSYSMLNFHEKIHDLKNIKTNNVLETIHKKLTQPIDSKSVARWKTELIQSELEEMDYVCSSYGKTYHYYASTHVKKNSFFLNLTTIRITHFFKVSTIKIYYTTPLFLRNFTRNISKYLFYKHGITTNFSEGDFRFEESKK